MDNDLRVLWPETVGEAVSTAWVDLEARGYSDPRSALIDLVNMIADGGGPVVES